MKQELIKIWLWNRMQNSSVGTELHSWASPDLTRGGWGPAPLKPTGLQHYGLVCDHSHNRKAAGDYTCNKLKEFGCFFSLRPDYLNKLAFCWCWVSEAMLFSLPAEVSMTNCPYFSVLQNEGLTVLICSSSLVFLSLMLPWGSEVTVMDVFYIANSQLELPASPWWNSSDSAAE